MPPAQQESLSRATAQGANPPPPLRVSVVIPAYNEEESLPGTLAALSGEREGLRAAGVEVARVVVGNNNSADATAAVAAAGGAEVAFCARRGYGGACWAAL